jgi:hypothetical protein
MSTVMVMHWPEVTPEQYEEARQKVSWERERPDGGMAHVAWFEDGLRVVDVWESPEHFERFGEERLMPVVKGEIGIEGEPTVSFVRLHALYVPDAVLP